MVYERAGRGSSEGPGKATTPGREPDDTPDRPRGKKKVVPIGRPVTREVFEAMKKAARKRKGRSVTPAQDDPSDD